MSADIPERHFRAGLPGFPNCRVTPRRTSSARSIDIRANEARQAVLAEAGWSPKVPLLAA